MNDERDDDEAKATITLDLPASLAAQLEELRRLFGDGLIADLLQKANAVVEGKLALCGGLLNKDCKSGASR
jgi:hypothetical protein